MGRRRDGNSEGLKRKGEMGRRGVGVGKGYELTNRRSWIGRR